MTSAEAIKTIFEEAKIKMNLKDAQAYEYVGSVIAFHVGRLNFENNFTPENMESALVDEADFHQRAEKQDVA